MNKKNLSSKMTDFLLNMAVVSFAVSLFEDNNTGFLVGGVALCIAIYLAIKQ